MFKLEIETGNDEFGQTHGERCQAIAAILRDLAKRMETEIAFGFDLSGRIRDANGNTVGSYSMTREG